MLIAFLLIVTFASLALSAGLLTYVLRLTREERDRSEARAASLEQALGGAKPLERWSPQMTFASDVATREAVAEESAASDLEHKPRFADDASSAEASIFAAHAASVDALTFPAGAAGAAAVDTPPVSRPMFGAHAAADESSAPDEKARVPRAILVPAAGVLVVALIAGLAMSVVWAHNRASGTTQATAQESTGAPLELVALKHERVGDSLHISGVVRNPQEGRVMKGLAAVAFLFDRDGNYLSSDRAALDYVQLQPGEESPFSIAVPSAVGVSRYRVTFRTDAGIVAHVDRRSDPPVVPAASR
jgi:hypothetical protein